MKPSSTISLFIVCFTCTVARADVLTLTPIADSSVDAFNPTAAIPTGPLQAAEVGTPGEQATSLTYFYAQYQLPAGMTGHNIQSINSIDLKLTRSPSSPTLSLTYYMYAVLDGKDPGSANTYTWNDGIGFDPTHTLVKGFADTDEISYYSDPSKSGFVGFIDTDSSGPPQRTFSFYSVQSATAVQNLQGLFLNDTDGRLTIYGKVRQYFQVSTLQTITSIEDGTRIAPTFTLDYVPAAAGVSGDYNNNGVVDAADYAVWRNSLGQSVTLPNDPTPGIVGQDDYDTWRQHFGATAASGSGIESAIVPEPMAVELGLLALVAVALMRRIKSRQLGGMGLLYN